MNVKQEWAINQLIYAMENGTYGTVTVQLLNGVPQLVKTEISVKPPVDDKPALG